MLCLNPFGLANMFCAGSGKMTMLLSTRGGPRSSLRWLHNLSPTSVHDVTRLDFISFLNGKLQLGESL